MSRSELRIRFLPAFVSLCLIAASATAAWGATANETGYACQLVRTQLINGAYAKGSSVEKRPAEVSEAYGKGTYTSGCRVKVTKKPRGAVGRSARRVYLGQIRLFAVVPAAGAAAEGWDADKLNASLLSGAEGLISSFGGATFAIPAYGQSEAHAYWLGNKQFSAEAVWRRTDAGFLIIELHDRAERVPRLERLLRLFAAGIVPGFSP